VEDLKRLAKESARVFPALKYPTSDDNMLEISIPDLHFGKLAWGAETGWENYDAKIAEDCFHKALGALLDRTKQHTYKKICFVVGNDLLHSDNPKGTTTAGTQVSCDGRFQKTFRTVRTLMTDAIERLSAIAPVNVVMVPGNHDTLAVWHLGDSLECYFNNSPNVAIDNQPRMRKYLRFGRVMLMFTHGDKGKREDYPLVMATEEPEMFGATFWREAHTGHRHQVRTSENHGVRVRILPALCAVDDWHSENQFVGNIRSAEAYIWNGSEGLIGTASYALPVTSTNRVKGQTK
jgi:DNA repair exonuclease SbcCD nuclease subunit